MKRRLGARMICVCSCAHAGSAERQSTTALIRTWRKTDLQKIISVCWTEPSLESVHHCEVWIEEGRVRDVLAQGVVDAAKQVKLSVPLVVRLAGTNFKEGKEILEKSNLKILSASDLNDAAKKIVGAIK